MGAPGRPFTATQPNSYFGFVSSCPWQLFRRRKSHGEFTGCLLSMLVACTGLSSGHHGGSGHWEERPLGQKVIRGSVETLRATRQSRDWGSGRGTHPSCLLLRNPEQEISKQAGREKEGSQGVEVSKFSTERELGPEEERSRIRSHRVTTERRKLEPGVLTLKPWADLDLMARSCIHYMCIYTHTYTPTCASGAH